jgi:hypothetical protein
VAVSVAPIEFPLSRRGHWNAIHGLEKVLNLEGTMYMDVYGSKLWCVLQPDFFGPVIWSARHMDC